MTSNNRPKARARRRAAIAAAILAAVVAPGCSGVIDTRGNMPLKEVVDEIKPGQQTREDISDMLGSPSTTATFGKQEVWYYIGERTETLAFFRPKIVERKVLSISFDRQGKVRGIATFDASDGKPVTLVERVTPTKGKTLGFLEQIIGNVGRFSTPDDD